MLRLRNVILATALFAAFGCATDVELGERPSFWNGTNNLTLFLYDAVTGEAILNATVTVRVGAHSITATQEENVYTAVQLPAGTFPIFITAPGYLDMIGTNAFTGTGTIINNSGQPNVNPGFTYVTLTGVMYPVSDVGEDVTIRVLDSENGQPLASGQLVLSLDPTTAVAAIVGEMPAAGVLDGQVGFLPTVLTFDVSGGTVTVPRGQLIFGGTYFLDVFQARDVDGRYLQPVQNQSFVAGISFPQILLFMGPAAQCPAAVGANNEDGGSQASLVVTFPYAVEICSDDANHTWSNDTTGGPTIDEDTDDDTVFAFPSDDVDPVNASLSSGGTVLTLTAVLDTDPTDTNDADDDLTVTFSGVQVRVAGSLTCVTLTSIGLRNFDTTPAGGCTAPGSTISATIQVR